MKTARFVVVFPKPKGDPKEFMAHYRNVHRGHANDIPNVLTIKDSTVEQHDMPVSVMEPYFISIVEFADMETLVASMASNAGQALMKDYQEISANYFSVPPICFTTTDGLPGLSA
ncbi:EthD domain-containing protein [Brevibacillus sp. NPDC058079]|uniref:EthD domain-containing protein n=1 Tax=Brevibacillus sp. NPDC058079 TaxID=3346330 RepID=UPI0036E368B1